MRKLILLFIAFLFWLGLVAQVHPEAALRQKGGFRDWAVGPPMGWNSYDAYYGCITERQFKGEVDALSKRMLPYGYEYAVIDYCWFNPGPKGWDPDYNWTTFDVGDFAGQTMDAYGRLSPAENRFPSAKGGKGFGPIAAYVHSKGMKFGIHIMRGIPRTAVLGNTPILGTALHAADIASLTDTCTWNGSMYGVDATKPGAQAYYNSLLNLYASWGVDFIKVDDISAPVYHQREIDLIRHAIDRCGRKIVLSLSPGDAPMGSAQHADNTANMYRVINDVWDRWKDILHDFDILNAWSPFTGNGTWPDGDMLPLGKLCLNGYPEAHNDPHSSRAEHFSYLSYAEQQTMLSLWCMARSPLIWGGSALWSADSTFALLSNREVLAIDKNSIRNHQLYLPDSRADNKQYRIWVAESPDRKTKYVALFNLLDHPADLSFKPEWEFWKGRFACTELWTGMDKGILTDVLVAGAVSAHGVALYKLTAL